MRLSISKLRFSLPDSQLAQYATRIDDVTKQVEGLTRSAGAQSNKFKRAFGRVYNSLKQGTNLSGVLKTAVDLRALATMFNTELESSIRLSPAVLQKIDTIRPKPGSLLTESIYSYYLTRYDRLLDRPAVEAWLIKAKKRRGELAKEDKHLLGGNGPKWLAEESHRREVDFDEQVVQVGLGRYREGRFLTVSKNIHYLDRLRGLEANEADPILEEMQKKSVYESRYDEKSLLGHQILSILIEKAPFSGIAKTWLNVVLAVGGDPRVSPAHPNYQKWWSQIDPRLQNKVKGWLSKIDLELFLNALRNISLRPGNDDLKRMYPARKRFMEGLLNKQLVTGTRLFISADAEQYLQRNYKKEHLPDYATVSGGISVIHIQLGSAQMIEGSHNCKLWIYERLDPSADVFDYGREHFAYGDLTSWLRRRMRVLGISPTADITHTPSNFRWQYKAITALREVGVPIASKDVLTVKDHQTYKRLYGA